MFVHLDLTPLYWGGLLIGLVIIAIGLGLRSSFDKLRGYGILIALVGALPAAAGAFLLVMDASEKVEAYWNRRVDQQLTADREIQGLRLPRGTTVQTYGGAPHLISALILIQPLDISGIPFEGDVDFAGIDAIGTSVVTKGTLATAHVIDGVPCQAHSEAEFSNTLPHADASTPKVTVGTLLHCKASAAFEIAGIRFAANSNFYLEGGPKLGTLAVDQDVDGVPCLAHKEVEFIHTPEAQKLIRCTLSKNFEVHGTRYAANAGLKFDDAGNVIFGVLAADQDINGRLCKKGTEVERGTRFTPAHDGTIDGIDYKGGGEIKLDSYGHFESAVLAHDQQFGAILCSGGDAIAFQFDFQDHLNHLDACLIRSSAKLLNVDWPAGSRLKGASLKFRLEVALPEDSGRVKIGDVTAVGPCTIELSTSQHYDFTVKAPPGKPAFAELLGAHFSSISIYEYDYDRRDGSGTGSGTLLDAATVNGTAYEAGGDVKLQGIHGPVRP
ncbi:MAG TPA: hypothetical protein VGL53_00350 [Bryobacteraceae bacterium]|jgi:hypothetical protein